MCSCRVIKFPRCESSADLSTVKVCYCTTQTANTVSRSIKVSDIVPRCSRCLAVQNSPRKFCSIIGWRELCPAIKILMYDRLTYYLTVFVFLLLNVSAHYKHNNEIMLFLSKRTEKEIFYDFNLQVSCTVKTRRV